MDTIDHEILGALQEDARMSWAELGRRVGLSAPAVTERVRQLEASGIITGYHAAVDPAKAGLGLQAIVRLTAPPELGPELDRIVLGTPEVLEFHHVTGMEGFVARVAVRDVEHLEATLLRLLPFGQTTTSIVLRSPVIRRPVSF